MDKNYLKEQDRIISSLDQRATLLLHSCCAPCSSYVLEFLSKHFDITILFYNPNIAPQVEYYRRLDELRMLLSKMPFSSDIKLIEDEFCPDDFYEKIKGHEDDLEGGERCFLCYELRLRRAAKFASENNFSYFATTLSISPHKNAKKLNEIGEMLEAEYGVLHLPSDFKKREGYKRSLELSAKYSLYRQDYCGCVFSRKN